MGVIAHADGISFSRAECSYSLCCLRDTAAMCLFFFLSGTCLARVAVTYCIMALLATRFLLCCLLYHINITLYY